MLNTLLRRLRERRDLRVREGKLREARENFNAAFQTELRRIDEERAHHANVRAAQAILHERVKEALRRGLSA